MDTIWLELHELITTRGPKGEKGGPFLVPMDNLGTIGGTKHVVYWDCNEKERKRAWESYETVCLMLEYAGAQAQQGFVMAKAIVRESDLTTVRVMKKGAGVEMIPLSGRTPSTEPNQGNKPKSVHAGGDYGESWCPYCNPGPSPLAETVPEETRLPPSLDATLASTLMGVYGYDTVEKLSEATAKGIRGIFGTKALGQVRHALLAVGLHLNDDWDWFASQSLNLLNDNKEDTP